LGGRIGGKTVLFLIEQNQTLHQEKKNDRREKSRLGKSARNKGRERVDRRRKGEPTEQEGGCKGGLKKEIRGHLHQCSTVEL